MLLLRGPNFTPCTLVLLWALQFTWDPPSRVSPSVQPKKKGKTCGRGLHPHGSLLGPHPYAICIRSGE